MEERALLAIIVSIMIIFLYQYFFVPKPAKREANIEKGQETFSEKEVSEKVEVIDKEDKEEIIFDEKIEKTLNAQREIKKRDYIVETKRYIARVTNCGALIKSWKLKDYKEQKQQETWPLKAAFWRSVGNSYKKIFKREEEKREEEQVEMIHEIDEKENMSLGIRSISEMENKFKECMYKVDEKEYFVDSNQKAKSLKMYFLEDRGIALEKEMIFYDTEYKIDVNLTIKNLSNKVQKIDYSLILGPGIGKGENRSEHHRYIGPAIWIDGEKKRIKPKKIIGVLEMKGEIEWIGIENTYFTQAIITKSESTEGIIFKKTIRDTEVVGIGIKSPISLLEPDGVINESYEVYIGPKRKEDLNNISENLGKIIDYGWFSFLAEPMIWLLNAMYRYIPNYGVAIIILTILIKIVFWPLTEKSFSSMRDMQKIQPKMTEIKEKHKDDPAKMNKEVMDLYKKQGVNPLGGCLPMILQIPVFFALYEGLMVAIEMREAYFFLWMTDLSAMDPLLITPVLMGITMYIQQRMMPTGMDPKQAKMMNMMPVIFTVFFLGFPSGLVIYWLLNNVLTIGHQYLIHKR